MSTQPGRPDDPAGGVAMIRRLVSSVVFPCDLPALTMPVLIGVVVLDRPADGFAVEIGPGWAVRTADLSGHVVHDTVLAVPAAAAAAIFTGAVDPGLATEHGTVTGTLGGQSALAFLIEAVATSRAGGIGDLLGPGAGEG